MYMSSFKRYRIMHIRKKLYMAFKIFFNQNMLIFELHIFTEFLKHASYVGRCEERWGGRAVGSREWDCHESLLLCVGGSERRKKLIPVTETANTGKGCKQSLRYWSCPRVKQTLTQYDIMPWLSPSGGARPPASSLAKALIILLCSAGKTAPLGRGG